MFIDLHAPLCALLNEVGALLLRMPSWDAYQEETQQLMRSFETLRRAACHSVARPLLSRFVGDLRLFAGQARIALGGLLAALLHWT